MATPEFQLQAPQIIIESASPGSCEILAFDTSGAVVNLSSGYDLNDFKCRPGGDQNVLASNLTLSSHVTATFTSTGLKLSWTAAQADTMAALMQVNNWNYVVYISNDSDVTQSMIARGSLNFQSGSTGL